MENTKCVPYGRIWCSPHYKCYVIATLSMISLLKCNIRFAMAKPAKNSIGLDAYFEHYYFQVNYLKTTK